MFKKFLASIVGFGKQLIAFILPIVETNGAQLIETALPLALTVVQSVESSSADSTAKRDAAVAQLKTALISSGAATESALTTSTLNWLVETAVQKLQAK
jgi:hypothetical protein